MTCPSPESLLVQALEGGDPVIARHASECLACRAQLDQLREATVTLQSQALLERRVHSPDCLDEMTLADFVDGRLAAEARTLAIRHLLTCAHCRSVVQATAAVVADEALAQAPEQRPRRTWLLPVTAAIAASLLIALWSREHAGRSIGTLREPALASTAAPVPVAPRAAISRVDRLVWLGVPGAERYRLRVFAADGSLVWSGETADTSVMLPRDSVVLAPRTTYFWRVEAETEYRRWVASDLVEFRLVDPR